MGTQDLHVTSLPVTISQDEFQHSAVVISVNKSINKWSCYNAVRYAWKISATRVRRADIVLAVDRRLIVGVFVAKEWLPATKENFPDRAENSGSPGRFGFIGHEASAEIQQIYLHKRLPEWFRKPGAANPIKYVGL